VNKDGSPDRRFSNNFQIPLAEYGVAYFTTDTGLREEFMVSNFQRAEAFADAWEAWAKAMGR
jgi:hypothetical protein